MVDKLGYEYRLVRLWSNDIARYKYDLIFQSGTKNGWVLASTGDRAWAERTAKHYKIKIESE